MPRWTPHLTRPIGRVVLIAALLAATAAVPAGSAVAASAPRASSTLCDGSERPRSRGFDAATRRDREFNRDFRHCFHTVEGVQMHAVVGGTGRPLVLLHGWPQTWFEWRALLPELARNRTVIAVDLPGLGDSTGSPATFDKKTLARFVHTLVTDELGHDEVDIAAHDLGAGVAWAYANEYREQVGRIAVMDFPLPGPGCPEPVVRGLSYHFPLFQEPGVPELLIDDEVRPFLEAFFPHVSPKPEPVPPAEVTEYVRTYERPQNLTNGFELYRTLARDEQDNTAYAATPLTQPVLVLAQDGAFEFEAACYRPGATDVTGTAIAGAGHWLNEEAPEAVLAEFATFFGAGPR